MKTNERYRISIISKLINGEITNQKAASKLNLSIRQVIRIKRRFKENKGKIGHRNKDRPPINKTDIKKETQILNLYRDKYYGFNFRHFSDKLIEKEGICVPYCLVYRILTKNGISSPKHHKKKTEKDIHPLRERRHKFGELIQIDASIHNWFGADKDKATLHGGIDDATGNIVGLYFDTYETLNGYYHLLHQILTKYGIPEAFYGDNRSVFEYKRVNQEEESNTDVQFKRCCNQLGIDLITTSVSQAKGRIERLWGTLQSRLISELRLNNICDIESANNYLPSFIEEYNSKYAVKPNDNVSAFVETGDIDLNLYLSTIVKRKINPGSAFRYKGKYYQCVNENGEIVKIHNKEEILLIHTFDSVMIAEYKDDLYDVIDSDYKPYQTNIPIKKERKFYVANNKDGWKHFVINAKKNQFK